MRLDPHNGLERERVGNIRDRQMLGGKRILAGGKWPTVDRHRFQLQLVAVERERRVLVFARRIAPNRELRVYASEPLVQVDVKVDRRDQKGRRSVVLEIVCRGEGIANRDRDGTRRTSLPNGRAYGDGKILR